MTPFELDWKIRARLERGDDPIGIAEVFRIPVDYINNLIEVDAMSCGKSGKKHPKGKGKKSK